MSINDYPSKLTGTAYYYVRTAWEDEESQLGQYRTLKSAIAKADANPGSFVFSGDGIAIYPEEEETMDTAEETVTVSEGTEEISLDEPEPTQDEPESTEEAENKEVTVSEEEAVKPDSDASEEGTANKDGTEEADAMTEAVEDAYPNDGNTETILYGKATTLVNIRDGNSLDAKARHAGRLKRDCGGPACEGKERESEPVGSETDIPEPEAALWHDSSDSPAHLCAYFEDGWRHSEEEAAEEIRTRTLELLHSVSADALVRDMGTDMCEFVVRLSRWVRQ